MSIRNSRLSTSLIIATGALVSQLLLVGCGKDEARKYDGSQYQSEAPTESGSFAEPHRIEAQSESHALTLAKNAKVSCSPGAGQNCHPAVGMLVEYTAPSEVGQCTAFLISPKIAMTNSHCIPEDLKREGSDCSGRIWIYFPELDRYSQTRVGCERILAASELSDKARDLPDYSIIQLDQAVDRPEIKVSREGFKDDGDYRIIKVNPESKSEVIGELEEASCKAKHNSILVAHSNNDLSPTMAMSDCEIVHGNSGSPLVDSEGNVHGLIQSTYNPSGPAHLSSKLPMLENPSFIKLGVGTTLACLNLPEEVQAPVVPSQCQALASAPMDQNSAMHTLEKSMLNEIELRLMEKHEALDPVYQWTVKGFSNIDQSYRFVAVPQCVRDMKALLDRHHGWFSDYEEKSEEKFDLYSINAVVGLDRFLKLEYRAQSPVDSASGVLNFSASSLSLNGTSSFQVEQRSLFVLSIRLVDDTLKACGDGRPTTTY